MAQGHVVAQGTVDEMRGYESRKRVSCVTSVPLEEVSSWTDVVHAAPGSGKRLDFMVTNAESVVRRLLAGDFGLQDLEVNRATLADAFLELTRGVQR
jgi:ABC-2 type transport system ATP-binding protein